MILTRDVAFFLVLGLVCFLFSVYKYSEAFPSASINLVITKDDASAIARDFARLSGFDVSDVSSQRYFNFDKAAATFLQYELGIGTANQLMKSKIPIWHWHVTLSDNDDDFSADVGTDGNIHFFEREVPTTLKLKSVDHTEAKNKVIEFVKRHTRIALSNWDLVRESQSDLQTQSIHSFTFQDRENDYNGGRLRLSATVTGEKVTRFNYFLHVPDEFNRKFATLRNQNRALANLPWIVIFIGVTSIPFIFLWAWIQNQLRVGLFLKVGLVATLICALTNLNETASVFASATNSHMPTYLAESLLEDFGTAVMWGLLLAVFFSSVEVVYRKKFPNSVAFENILNGKVLNSNSLTKSAFLGLALFGILIGYQTVFYLVGRNVGFWAPLQVTDTSVLGSFCPPWDAFSLGIKASTLEEVGFRVFLLVVFQRLTGSFWIGNILQAVTWGLGHCSYAVEPPYVRGLELAIAGILFGWVMRKYGIVPLVLSHYAFDAYLTVLPLVSSNNPIDKLIAFVPLAPLFILIAVALFIINRSGLVDDDKVANSSIVPAQSSKATERQSLQLQDYVRLKPEFVSNAFLCMFILAGTCFLPVRTIDSAPVLRVNRETAIAVAKKKLEEEGFDLNGMQVSAWLLDMTGRAQMQYVYDHLGFRKTKSLEGVLASRLVWNVRWFRLRDTDFLNVEIGPDGSVLTTNLDLDNLTEGAKLSSSEALSRAEDCTKHTNIGRLNTFSIRDTSRTDRPGRIDYNFVAEFPGLEVSKAKFCVALEILGDHVTNVRRYWSLPREEHDVRIWRRNKSLAINILRLLAAGMFVANFGYWAMTILRENGPNKRMVAVAVSAAFAVMLIHQANYDVVHLYDNYSAGEPLDAFWIRTGLSFTTTFSFNVILFGFLAVVASACYLPPDYSIKQVTDSMRSYFSNHFFWFDGVLLGLMIAAVVLAANHLGVSILSLLSPSVSFSEIGDLHLLDRFSPGLSVVLASMRDGCLAVLIGAIVLKWRRFYDLEPIHLILLCALMSCVWYGDENYLQNFAAHVLIVTSCIAAAYYLAFVVGRRNLCAIFFAAVFLRLYKDSTLLFLQMPGYQLDVAFLGFVSVVPLFWLIFQAIILKLKERSSQIAGSE